MPFMGLTNILIVQRQIRYFSPKFWWISFILDQKNAHGPRRGDRPLRGVQCGDANEPGEVGGSPGKSSLFFVRDRLPGISLPRDRDAVPIKERAFRGVRCTPVGPWKSWGDRYRHSPWPVDVTELFPRFYCWTLIWLSLHWAWLHRGYWCCRSLIDWSIDWSRR